MTKKITDLTAVTIVADTDTSVSVVAGVTLKYTFAQVKTWVKAWVTKTDVGLSNVDNTSDSAKFTAFADTDGTLAANVDTKFATQKAVKTYVDGVIARQDAMVFMGVIDCSANPNYPAADRGNTYRVSVAGKIGGGSGTAVEVGDILICLTDGTAAGNQATVGAQWGIIETNVDGAVTGPASATGDNIATFNGATGKIIKDGGKALPSGPIVGTTDTQTLSGKTLTAPVMGSYTDHTAIAAPASTAGRVWFDSTANQLRIWINGATEVIAKRWKPKFIGATGRTLRTTAQGATATTTIVGAADRIEIIPYVAPFDMTISQASVNVTTGVALATGKVVIYDSNAATGKPGALLFESASTMDFSSIAVVNTTISPSISLKEGQQIWIGVRHSSTATVSAWALGDLTALDAGAASTTVGVMLRQTQTFATGASNPWVYSTSDHVASAPPAVWLLTA